MFIIYSAVEPVCIPTKNHAKSVFSPFRQRTVTIIERWSSYTHTNVSVLKQDLVYNGQTSDNFKAQSKLCLFDSSYDSKQNIFTMLLNKNFRISVSATLYIHYL